MNPKSFVDEFASIVINLDKKNIVKEFVENQEIHYQDELLANRWLLSSPVTLAICSTNQCNNILLVFKTNKHKLIMNCDYCNSSYCKDCNSSSKFRQCSLCQHWSCRNTDCEQLNDIIEIERNDIAYDVYVCQICKSSTY